MDKILSTHTGSLVRPAALLGLMAADGDRDEEAHVARVGEEIRWTERGALAAGARIASRELWGARAAV